MESFVTVSWRHEGSLCFLLRQAWGPLGVSCSLQGRHSVVLCVRKRVTRAVPPTLSPAPGLTPVRGLRRARVLTMEKQLVVKVTQSSQLSPETLGRETMRTVNGNYCKIPVISKLNIISISFISMRYLYILF